MKHTRWIVGWSLSLGSLLLSMNASSAEPALDATAQAAPKAGTDAMPAVKTLSPVGKDEAPLPAATSATGQTSGNRRPGSDRLNLDTTIVTGNRELPKVLYIVPWKRADLGDLPPQPFNSLLDEVLTPVDRDVFRREVTYFGAMSEQDGARSGAPAASAAGSEK